MNTAPVVYVLYFNNKLYELKVSSGDKRNKGRPPPPPPPQKKKKN